VVEGVVAVVDVVVAPAQLPRVGCENAGREARVDGTLKQRNGQLVVMRHVQLEKAGAVSVRLAYILDRL